MAGSTVDDRLEVAFLEFSSQCKRHKISFLAFPEGFLTGSFVVLRLRKSGAVQFNVPCQHMYFKKRFVFRFWAQETFGSKSWTISNHCPKAFQWSWPDLSYVQWLRSRWRFFSMGVLVELRKQWYLPNGLWEWQWAWQKVILITHTISLGLVYTTDHFMFCCVFLVRLRAAVFINACAMRDAVTLRQGPILTPTNLRKLQTANYLFHSSLNWSSTIGIYAFEIWFIFQLLEWDYYTSISECVVPEGLRMMLSPRTRSYGR